MAVEVAEVSYEWTPGGSEYVSRDFAVRGSATAGEAINAVPFDREQHPALRSISARPTGAGSWIVTARFAIRTGPRRRVYLGCGPEYRVIRQD